MNQGTTAPANDQRARLAYMILGVVAVLIGVSIWLAGRKNAGDKFSYDNLRKMVFGEDRG
jgi:hypothetical protein